MVKNMVEEPTNLNVNVNECQARAAMKHTRPYRTDSLPEKKRRENPQLFFQVLIFFMCFASPTLIYP